MSIASASPVLLLLQFHNVPSESIELSELHLEILKLAWLEWNEAQSNTAVSGGVTREELFLRMRGKFRTRWKPQKQNPQPRGESHQSQSSVEEAPPALIRKSETLKGHLKALSTDQFRRLVAKRTADYAGAPFVYMINDLTTATYSSTAFLLVHLFRLRHIEQRDLIKAMLVQNEVVFLPATSSLEERVAEIKQQIDWCLHHQYLEYVDKHPTELHFTARLHSEYRFLEFVASHPRLAGDGVARA